MLKIVMEAVCSEAQVTNLRQQGVGMEKEVNFILFTVSVLQMFQLSDRRERLLPSLSFQARE